MHMNLHTSLLVLVSYMYINIYTYQRNIHQNEYVSTGWTGVFGRKKTSI
jgi:hypothetical protein